jgi:hypothetical protein
MIFNGGNYATELNLAAMIALVVFVLCVLAVILLGPSAAAAQSCRELRLAK